DCLPEHAPGAAAAAELGEHRVSDLSAHAQEEVIPLQAELQAADQQRAAKTEHRPRRHPSLGQLLAARVRLEQRNVVGERHAAGVRRRKDERLAGRPGAHRAKKRRLVRKGEVAQHDFHQSGAGSSVAGWPAMVCQPMAARTTATQATLPQVTADCAARCSRRSERISSAKKTLERRAIALPAMPRLSNLPTKKSAIPPMAAATAIASRARIGSCTTIGESSSTQTT